MQQTVMVIHSLLSVNGFTICSVDSENRGEVERAVVVSKEKIQERSLLSRRVWAIQSYELHSQRVLFVVLCRQGHTTPGKLGVIFRDRQNIFNIVPCKGWRGPNPPKSIRSQPPVRDTPAEQANKQTNKQMNKPTNQTNQTNTVTSTYTYTGLHL